jgi:hypothetical protein
MKIIITESQLNLLKKLTLTESEELNQYGLTSDELSQVEDLAEKEALESLENLKKNIKEKEEEVETYSKWDFSHIKDEYIIDHIKKSLIEPAKKELDRLKKILSEYDIEKVKERLKDWHIYSAGGLGWSFRYNRYREETLKRTLTKNDIIDLFVTALEGGSNYWYHMDLPDNIKSFGDSISKAVGEYILQGGYIEFYDVEEYDRILRDKERGDYNIQGDVEDEKSFNEDLEETKLGYVDMDKILEAITIIKKDYPKVWENILLENADAADADVFLQLCVMGEIVFG